MGASQPDLPQEMTTFFPDTSSTMVHCVSPLPSVDAYLMAGGVAPSAALQAPCRHHPPPPSPSHTMVTRSKIGSLHPNKKYALLTSSITATAHSPMPNSIRASLVDSNWSAVMEQEFVALQQN
jgi:hypothetical protein